MYAIRSYYGISVKGRDEQIEVFEPIGFLEPESEDISEHTEVNVENNFDENIEENVD